MADMLYVAGSRCSRLPRSRRLSVPLAGRTEQAPVHLKITRNHQKSHSMATTRSEIPFCPLDPDSRLGLSLADAGDGIPLRPGKSCGSPKLVWQPPDCLGVVPAVKNVDRSLYEACSVWTAKCHWLFRRKLLSQSSLAEAFWHIKIAHK